MRFSLNKNWLLNLIRPCSAAFALALSATAAHAAYNVTISTAATSNGSLSGGVFTPTGNGAILNNVDLQNALATSSVTVTTGTGGSQRGNIVVAGRVSWSSNTLTLDAFRSVTVTVRMKAMGTGGLAALVNDGGSGGELSFSNGGRMIFQNTAQSLTINGAAYTLVADIPTLATDISGNSHGNFALMENYDASSGLTFTSAPIPNDFYGTFEGLGNTISNFKMIISTNQPFVAFFARVLNSGAVRDLNLTNIYINNMGGQNLAAVAAENFGLVENVTIDGQVLISSGTLIGTLVATNLGTVSNCQSSATITGTDAAEFGGLVGNNEGTITGSSATGDINTPTSTGAGGLAEGNGPTATISLSFATNNVSGGFSGPAGGLVGANAGTITESYATGSVSQTAAGSNYGGLVGGNAGVIFNTYALGNVTAAATLENIGGLIGVNQSPASVGSSYSIGIPSRGVSTTGNLGGFLGLDNFSGSITTSYWDTTTSGITSLSQGAGSPANDVGITGLSDTALKSGLPSGFSSSTWGQSPTINGGLPYLLNNPPS
jgi:hypothetical protein